MIREGRKSFCQTPSFPDGVAEVIDELRTDSSPTPTLADVSLLTWVAHKWSYVRAPSKTQRRV